MHLPKFCFDMHSRRRILAACIGAAGTVFAGCLSEQPGTKDTPKVTPTGPTDTLKDTPTSSAGTPTDTLTETCIAQEPPAPTDAATSPRSYPDRPAELTTESIKEFLEAYETAYQYNDALSANPNKIGRTNEITVRIHSISVSSEPERFTANVSGQFQSDIINAGTPKTPETPTETPLPMGHGPVEASYTVKKRKLSREGVVLECW